VSTRTPSSTTTNANSSSSSTTANSAQMTPRATTPLPQQHSHPLPFLTPPPLTSPPELREQHTHVHFTLSPHAPPFFPSTAIQSPPTIPFSPHNQLCQAASVPLPCDISATVEPFQQSNEQAQHAQPGHSDDSSSKHVLQDISPTPPFSCQFWPPTECNRIVFPCVDPAWHERVFPVSTSSSRPCINIPADAIINGPAPGMAQYYAFAATHQAARMYSPLYGFPLIGHVPMHADECGTPEPIKWTVILYPDTLRGIYMCKHCTRIIRAAQQHYTCARTFDSLHQAELALATALSRTAIMVDQPEPAAH
jgi:hypothetical protein